MNLKLPAQFLLFVGFLVLLNLIQAAVTPLIFDEAYYWYFAQDLAWGYFDHPPMVAALIKISSFFAGGELGVRFISSLLSGATALILWKIIDHPQKSQFIPHFFVLLFSMVLVNAYGFLTLPDTPLLFFTALFLLLYQNFLKKPGWVLAIGIGLVMAGLMYSKYHAFLVIFTVGISNLRLLRSAYAWAAIAIALFAYLPHLLWLYELDFVSIQYHLFDRPNRAYDFSDFTLGYLVNLIAIFGLTFPWIYYSLYKATRWKDNFTRALLFLAYGVLLFFLASSFDRRVQTQWIIVVCIPIFLLVYTYMIGNSRIRKYLMYTGVINGIIILILRVGLVYEPLFPIVYETHGNEEWVSEIKKEAGDLPVVFENSYRRAPMYAFYTGQPTFSLNNVMYRRNQYSIDHSESRVRDKPVYYVTSYEVPEADVFKTEKGELLYGKKVAYFEPYRKLRIEVIEKDERNIVFKVLNPYERAIDLDEVEYGVAFLNAYKQVIQVVPISTDSNVLGVRQLPPKSDLEFSTTLPEPTVNEAAFYKLIISENNLYWGLNGSAEKLNNGG